MLFAAALTVREFCRRRPLCRGAAHDLDFALAARSPSVPETDCTGHTNESFDSRDIGGLRFLWSDRWTLGARDMLFTNPVLAWFAWCAKVLPVERRAGLMQPVRSFASYHRRRRRGTNGGVDETHRNNGRTWVEYSESSTKMRFG
jgi:hypothetical protein